MARGKKKKSANAGIEKSSRNCQVRVEVRFDGMIQKSFAKSDILRGIEVVDIGEIQNDVNGDDNRHPGYPCSHPITPRRKTRRKAGFSLRPKRH